MTVNFSSNAGYVPSKSYSNVNFAQRNENMEAPKKSNTKKYVAAGVGLAAIAAAIVFRKPIGQAAKNLLGKIKLFDFSSAAKKVGRNVTEFGHKAKVKAGEFYNTAKTTVKDLIGKISGKATAQVNGVSAGGIGNAFGKIWQGAKNYAVKGWEFAKTYGNKAIEWVKNIVHKLFHKPVTPTVPYIK